MFVVGSLSERNVEFSSSKLTSLGATWRSLTSEAARDTKVVVDSRAENNAESYLADAAMLLVSAMEIPV